MPTREQMIAELKAQEQGTVTPSREQMIQELKARDQMEQPVDTTNQKQITDDRVNEASSYPTLNEIYSNVEPYLERGVQAVSPVLGAIGQVSKAGSEAMRGGIEQTLPGMLAAKGREYLGSLIPESVKNRQMSEIIPSLYSETGEGLALQRGGAFDPTLSGVTQGLKEMATDPLNLLAAPGALAKVATLPATAAKGALKTGASALSGVPKRVMANYVKFAPEIEQIKNAGGVTSEMVTGLQENVASAIKDKLSQTGQKLAYEIDNAGGFVDMSKIKQPFEQAEQRALASFNKNPTAINKTKLEKISEIKNNYFANIEQMPTAQAFDLQQDLKELMAFSGKPTLESKFSGMSQADKAITDAASKSYNELNNQFNSLTKGLSGSLKNEYKNLIQQRKILEPIASDPNKTLQALKSLGRKDKVVLRNQIKKIDKELGTNINDSVDLLETYSYLGEPSWNPLSGGGVTSTSRTLAGGALGSVLGGGAPGFAIGSMAASPAMLKQGLNVGIKAGELGQGIRQALPNINLPQLTDAQRLALIQATAMQGQNQ